MTRNVRSIALTTLASAALAMALSSCGAPQPETVASPTKQAAQSVELYPEDDVADESPAVEETAAPTETIESVPTVEAAAPAPVESAEEADTAAAAEVKTAVDKFFESVGNEAKVAVVAGGGEISPQISTLDEHFKGSFKFIDRNAMTTKQSASLVYGIASSFADKPDMTVTIDPSLIKIEGDTAVVAASDMTLTLSDGSEIKPSTEDTSKIGLSKASGSWLIVSDS